MMPKRAGHQELESTGDMHAHIHVYIVFPLQCVAIVLGMWLSFQVSIIFCYWLNIGKLFIIVLWFLLSSSMQNTFLPLTLLTREIGVCFKEICLCFCWSFFSPTGTRCSVGNPCCVNHKAKDLLGMSGKEGGRREACLIGFMFILSDPLREEVLG